jgi:hypothetical protein
MGVKHKYFESYEFRRLKLNTELPEQILELSTPHQFLNYPFFINQRNACEHCQETNFYGSHMNQTNQGTVQWMIFKRLLGFV